MFCQTFSICCPRSTFHPVLGPQEAHLKWTVSPRLHWLPVCSWVWPQGRQQEELEGQEEREFGYYSYPRPHLTSPPWVLDTESLGPGLSCWYPWRALPFLVLSLNLAPGFVTNPLNSSPSEHAICLLLWLEYIHAYFQRAITRKDIVSLRPSQ